MLPPPYRDEATFINHSILFVLHILKSLVQDPPTTGIKTRGYPLNGIYSASLRTIPIPRVDYVANLYHMVVHNTLLLLLRHTPPLRTKFAIELCWYCALMVLQVPSGIGLNGFCIIKN